MDNNNTQTMKDIVKKLLQKKLFVGAAGGVLLIGILIIVLSVMRGEEPSGNTVLRFDNTLSAQEKEAQTDYRAEYTNIIDTTINGDNLEQKFRIAVLKLGSIKKTSVFANSVILLQELFEENNITTLCNYGRMITDVSCFVVPKDDRAAQIESGDVLFQALKNMDVVTMETQRKTVSVGGQERACDQERYELQPENITEGNIKGLFSGLLESDQEGEDASTFAEELAVIKEVSSSICYDAQTGVPLEMYSFTRYERGESSFVQETTQKAELLIVGPVVLEGDFEIPRK
jgi:hypothetical protein